MLIEAQMCLDLHKHPPPPPKQEHPPPPPPHKHTHHHDIGAPHIDIQGDVRIIFDKPRWSPHSLKSIYNQPVRM